MKNLFGLLAAAALAAAIPPDVSSGLQNILRNTHKSKAYQYPTDLTRGIIPKPIHSHNDYWRDVPFFSALSVGCVSIEADVWLINGTLYIGHEASALTAERTFDSLYIQPILDVLKRENPPSPYLPVKTKNGVFDTSGGQTLYLWVDVKTDGLSTFPAVIKGLEPLRSAGYLTTFDGRSTHNGPVTVIGTGNTPIDQVQGVSPRDYFYDAPLPYLNTTAANITADVSPIASTDFVSQFGTISGTSMNDTQIALLREQIAGAKEKGIGVRYWDTPAWPISTRNAVWRTLVDAGVALLNADDIIAAAGLSEESGYW